MAGSTKAALMPRLDPVIARHRPSPDATTPAPFPTGLHPLRRCRPRHPPRPPLPRPYASGEATASAPLLSFPCPHVAPDLLAPRMASCAPVRCPSGATAPAHGRAQAPVSHAPHARPPLAPANCRRGAVSGFPVCLQPPLCTGASRSTLSPSSGRTSAATLRAPCAGLRRGPSLAAACARPPRVRHHAPAPVNVAPSARSPLCRIRP